MLRHVVALPESGAFRIGQGLQVDLLRDNAGRERGKNRPDVLFVRGMGQYPRQFRPRAHARVGQRRFPASFLRLVQEVPSSLA